MTYGYTYRTTCLENGKVYVGQKRTEGFRPDYLGSGKLIRRAVKKHGRHVFIVEVLDFHPDKPALDRAEQRAIIEHRSLLGREAVYNIADGGMGSPGYKMAEEEKRRRSERFKGSRNPQFGIPRIGFLNPHYGHKHSWKARETIGIKNSTHKGHDHGNFGIKRTAEQVEKNRIGHIGQKAPNLGTPHSIETRRKISERAKAKFASGFKCAFTEETRRKISEGRKRYWAYKKEIST